MRELSQQDREKILNKVRALLSDKNICPFYFRNDFARVISGEEEAIYSWCATNLLMGSLLPNSLGQGTVVSPNSTYGTLDLGKFSSPREQP
jgi:Golgi nucleoside diphosphatase